MMRYQRFVSLSICLVFISAASGRAFDKARPGLVPTPSSYVKKTTWPETVLASRDALARAAPKDPVAESRALWRKLDRDFPVQSDWLLQDLGAGRLDWFGAKDPADTLAPALVAVKVQSVPSDAKAMLDAYVAACETRRRERLATVLEQAPLIVYAKHFNMGASHYAYMEGQSDAQAERHFYPGTELCLLDMQGIYGKEEKLIVDPDGVIRDPNVSWDGERILFAWKKSDRLDDYHLYELDASRTVRQLTHGLGFADYEGAYLPNGDIIFNSTRCVQTVDCWWTEVSNLYTCDRDGRFLRRVTIDQVHDNYPQVMSDGRVTYTRWEYVDRGQVYVQSLFQMNPDGTGQTEFYGNNSWFPTSLLHARGIPGTGKVMAIASGHHSSQAGKLVVVDPTRGRQENTGVQLVGPTRDTPAVKIDAYGQDGPVWMYPYPLNEQECLVSYSPEGRETSRDRQAGWFRIYYMHVDGTRELLAADPERSCHQPVVLAARECPAPRPRGIDYSQDTGVYYMQDVYVGEGMQGVPRGTAKVLRVVRVDFRAAGVGANGSRGPAGGALSSTPPAIGNGSWDPKAVLGTTPIHEDGSAMFVVPALAPVQFQVLDASNHVIQTMRSWSTLQPGETFSCTGCHEENNESPPVLKNATMAMEAGPKPLTPFYGPARGFSYLREVQPILDRHCIRCHAGGEKSKTPFGLRGVAVHDAAAKRNWAESYLALTGVDFKKPGRKGAFYGNSNAKLVNWVSAQSTPPVQPPYSVGAAKSGLIAMLHKGHNDVKLSAEEFDKLACWIDLCVPYCGDYTEAAAWNDAEIAKYDRYLGKRQAMEAMAVGNVEEFLGKRVQRDDGVLLSVAVVDAAGKVVAESEGGADPSKPLVLDFRRTYRAGDRIRVRGADHLGVSLDAWLGESAVFTTNGVWEFDVPGPDVRDRIYGPGVFDGDAHHVSVRPLAVSDLDCYRNLACNGYDVQGHGLTFPHATSNSECRNDPVFAARNAIDGDGRNAKHGRWPYQSWGPDKREDLVWRVDFGREVEIDKVVIVVRADFPHDRHWHAGQVVLSNGWKMGVKLEKTAAPQVFRLRHPMRTRSVELSKLVQIEPLGWCAISEIEIWGRDPVPIAADPEQMASALRP